MKFMCTALLCLLPLAAQEIKLPASFDKLASIASDTVEVTLDGTMLQLAAKFLSDRDPDQAKAKRLVMGLKSITVKVFTFDSRGEYTDADIEPLRQQLKAPGWSRIVGVRSKRGGENAEVFVKADADKFSGLAVLVADPRELTFVNIVGPISPEDLRDLGGNFGIPRFDGFGRKKDNRDEE
jgi:hypothetical protein